MKKSSILIKKKLIFFLVIFSSLIALLIIRIFYIQAFKGDELQVKAYEQQTRDRLISPNRGGIFDRNMVSIATTETVASVSVINSQIKNKEQVAKALSEKLEMDYDLVLKKVSRRVALERIKIKVDKQLADEIRNLNLAGVVVDEDIKRIYPYSTLASQVIGFVGKDNQGIIGLEAKYEKYLKGSEGKILTQTDVKGREIKGGTQERIDPKDGNNLVTTIDVIIQQYAEQTLEKIVELKESKRGAIIMMNPQNGEIIAMANKPDFDLNDPFTINDEELLAIWDTLPDGDKNKYLNQMWRNFSINDTYEPGSTSKIITAAAGLQEGVITTESHFNCSGYEMVAGRMIKCWRYPNNHGLQTFIQGVQNSCNPVFMETAEKLGAETFYKYMVDFGFKEKTGIDLPGEAVGILHKLENVGPLELATMAFGQSFQITPLQLLRASSATVNGGYLVTPHFGKQIIDNEGNIIEEFKFEKGKQVISKEVSDTMQVILESVVSTGTGNKTYIPGYRIGGKTATSEKLPRGNQKYIASFLTIAPAENPQVITLVLIDEPKGVYYGGQVAGPVMKELLENSLPYLNIETKYSEEELKKPEIVEVVLPDFIGQTLADAKKQIKDLGLKSEIIGEGDIVVNQFPLKDEKINSGSKIKIYVESK